MREMEQLLDKIAQYIASDDIEIVQKAGHFAEKSHEGYKRIDGTPYILHPLAVANILADWCAPPEVISAGLLHDILKPWYSKLSSLPVEENFSPTIATLIKGVTELSGFGPSLIRSLSEIPIDEN